MKRITAFVCACLLTVTLWTPVESMLNEKDVSTCDNQAEITVSCIRPGQNVPVIE